MSDIPEHITEIAKQFAPLCRHVSVGADEVGPFIFAIAKRDTRSLELREIDGEYVLELWSGQAAEHERIEEESRHTDSDAAVERSIAWLQSEARLDA